MIPIRLGKGMLPPPSRKKEIEVRIKRILKLGKEKVELGLGKLVNLVVDPRWSLRGNECDRLSRIGGVGVVVVGVKKKMMDRKRLVMRRNEEFDLVPPLVMHRSKTLRSRCCPCWQEKEFDLIEQ